ncbi:MAG: hypothetical protein J7K89_01805 [Candidatus Cloacimonetes bacterium]|nr:hypothetical protein [Candidatus Cloacimonadota bacterium]
MSETRKILDMVSEGTITAAEAAQLLAAMGPKPPQQGKKFVILVTREEHSHPKLHISLPVSVVKLAARLIPSNAQMKANMGETNFDFSSIKWKELFTLVAAGEVGDLFYADVEEDDGSVTTVRIYVE